jgi:hypothetical protein
MLRSRSNAAPKVDRIEAGASKIGIKKRERKRPHLLNSTPSISTIVFCAISFAITCFVTSISYSNFLRHHHELHHHSKHLRGKSLNENEIPNSIMSELDEPISADSIYNLEYPTMKHHGELFSLSKFVGRISIVINVACA